MAKAKAKASSKQTPKASTKVNSKAKSSTAGNDLLRNLKAKVEAAVKGDAKAEIGSTLTELEEIAAKHNPFCPLDFAFRDAETYNKVFGTRHHTTGQGWSGGSHGPVDSKGHTYDDSWGCTPASLYVSRNGQEPCPVADRNEQVHILAELSSCSSIKIGGWGSGMKDTDFYESIGQICPVGDKEFHGKHLPHKFTMKNAGMQSDYLEALMRVLDPCVQSILASLPADEGLAVHWDGDELWDVGAHSFNNYGPLVWALSASLHSRGRLKGLLAVKQSRTKWTKSVGSEPKNSREDKWYRENSPQRDGKPRTAFPVRYFRESNFVEMLAFISRHGRGPVPDMVVITHSCEKNRWVCERQDGTGYGYFGASVQSGMAQRAGAQAMVVMFGGGDVIYKEMSNQHWTGTAAVDKATRGYKAGTKIIAFDVRRKEQSGRCKIFELEGEPETIFDGVRGRVMTVA